MTPDKIAEEYLRWRLEQMKAEAPAAPSASQLIERALPWWEKSPERFRALVGQLETIRTGHGHNGNHPNSSPDGHAVPALLLREEVEIQSSARVLDFKIHDGKLHFRFQLEPPLAPVSSSMEVTFISDASTRPLFFAPAFGSEENGYIVYADLLPELVREWAPLDEANGLPLRLIIRVVP
jgi:hypothetical protein